LYQYWSTFVEITVFFHLLGEIKAAQGLLPLRSRLLFLLRLWIRLLLPLRLRSCLLLLLL
jgi:hypothetical protein